jgi:L-amino acid N-acyltransferase YncA
MNEDSANLTIRPARDDDFPGMWTIYEQVARAGDTYPHATDVGHDEAFDYWMRPPRTSYVGIGGDRVVGMYYLRPNQETLGAHVANAGYCVDKSVRKLGVGRRLCEHSIAEARRLGYLAMQFNLVVSTNVASIRMARSCGFEIVGTLPRAFRHRDLGLVDAHVMYQWIGE